MSKPAISKHLKVLENAGLVTSEKEGLFVHYRLAKDNLFTSLNDFLVNFCPEGRPLKVESAAIGRKNGHKPGLGACAVEICDNRDGMFMEV